MPEYNMVQYNTMEQIIFQHNITQSNYIYILYTYIHTYIHTHIIYQHDKRVMRERAKQDPDGGGDTKRDRTRERERDRDRRREQQ